MPRDYKHTAKKKNNGRKKRSQALPWPWAVVPAAAVLLGTAAYWYYSYDRSSGADAPNPPSAHSSTPERPAQNDAPPRPEKQSNGARFEFYTLLPEIEVEITDEDLGAALKALPEQAHKGPYLLQAGSFRHFEEADNLKARLALLGIQAKIQTVTINNESTWYRVRIGPYDTLKDLKPIRSRLKDNDVDFMLMSVKGEG